MGLRVKEYEKKWDGAYLIISVDQGENMVAHIAPTTRTKISTTKCHLFRQTFDDFETSRSRIEFADQSNHKAYTGHAGANEKDVRYRVP